MDDYYKNQAGSGIGGFHGVRYQKGSGFFGRFITGSVLPVLKKVLPYLGKTAINTGQNVLADMANGENAKTSIRRRLKESSNKVGRDAEEKLRMLTGNGVAVKRVKGRRNKRRPKRLMKTKTKNPKRKTTTTKVKRSQKGRSKRRLATKTAVDFL